MGYLPEALGITMAFLGWSNKTSQSEILSLKELTKIFNLSDVNKAEQNLIGRNLIGLIPNTSKKWNRKNYVIFKNYWEDIG